MTALERPHPPEIAAKPPVPLYYWPLWIVLLAIGLFVFYVLFTPVWIGIRLVAWLSEHSRRRPARPPAAA